MTRMPGATWRPISRNYTPRRRERTNACINHVDAGNATSLYGWFNNPDARASSHLFVKRGTPEQIAKGLPAEIEQYIDLDLISWCNAKGDARAVTVETAGYAAGVWDPAQQLALINIWRFVSGHYGVPLTLMRDSKPDTEGIGYHWLGVPATYGQKADGISQTGGELWSSSVGKTCPGPDRIKQMPSLVTRAASPAFKPAVSTALIQTRLTELGYYAGLIDGDYGPMTTAAVTAYQEANGLYPDGLWGPVTEAHYQEDTLSAAEVKEIKDYMAALLLYGYQSGGQSWPGVAKVDIENQRRITEVREMVKQIAEATGTDIDYDRVRAAAAAGVADALAAVDANVSVTVKKSEG